MAQPPIKSKSKKIQEQHIRRYKAGKITVVNKGINHPTLQTPIITPYKPEIAPQPAEKSKGSQPSPNVVLRPKMRPTEPPPTPAQIDKYANEMVGALSFPTIAFQGQEDSYPKSLKDKIPIARLLQLMKTHQHQTDEPFSEYATDEEALGYLSTMSLVAPLTDNAAKIMMYLFNKVWDKKNIPSELIQKSDLNDMQKSDLKRLKQDIRKTQWEVFKKRMKEGKDAQDESQKSSQ